MKGLDHVIEIHEERIDADIPQDTILYAKLQYTLGEIYERMYCHAWAKPFYVKAMKIYKEQLGETHPLCIASLEKLGELCRYMRWDDEEEYFLTKAEYILTKVIEIRKEQVGEDHLDYAEALNKLASLYWRMGRYEEAEPLCIDVMGIRKDRLGERHPDYVSALRDLGRLYEIIGRRKRDKSYEYVSKQLLFKAADAAGELWDYKNEKL